MRYVFIANPNAGKKGRYSSCLARVKAYCESSGLDYKILYTSCGDDLTTFARQEASVGDDVRIFVLGGDGAVCRAVSGMVGFANAELGCIPCGSGNDYVKSFGGAKNFLDVEKYINAPSRFVDAISTGGDGGLTSLNICSMGLDAMICDRVNRMKKTKKLLGESSYSLSVLISFLGRVYNTLKITIDDEFVYEGDFIFSLAASGKYYGGGYCGAPNANPSDGLLDFIMVRRVSKLRMLTLVGMYKKGKHLDSPRFKDIVTFHRGKRMTVESNQPAVVNIDGECLMLDRVTFELIPNAVRFIVNDNT